MFISLNQYILAINSHYCQYYSVISNELWTCESIRENILFADKHNGTYK